MQTTIPSIRASLPDINYFDIQSLHKMPKFYDWITCQINSNSNFEMFLGGGDDGVAMKYFWNGVYEKHSTYLWSVLATNLDGTVLDIGAHTGVYSLIANTVNARQVISFEPHFMNYARLILNLRKNGFKSKNALMLGVGDSNTTGIMSIPTNIDYLSTGGSIGAKPGCINFPINITSIDNFCADSLNNIKLIKIDVENYEDKVLLGGIKTLSSHKPTIFFECLSDSIGTYIHDFLKPLGYSFWIIDDNKCRLIKTSELRAEFSQNGKINMSRLNRIASCNPITNFLD